MSIGRGAIIGAGRCAAFAPPAESSTIAARANMAIRPSTAPLVCAERSRRTSPELARSTVEVCSRRKGRRARVYSRYVRDSEPISLVPSNDPLKQRAQGAVDTAPQATADAVMSSRPSAAARFPKADGTAVPGRATIGAIALRCDTGRPRPVRASPSGEGDTSSRAPHRPL